MILITALIFFISCTLAVSITETFGILDGFESEQGLFSLVTFVFSLSWLLGWSLGVAAIAYIFLLTLFGRSVVLLNNGQLEVSFGIAVLRTGSRIPSSEIVSVDLFDIEDTSDDHSGYQKLIITFKNDSKTFMISADFTSQDLAKLQTALTLSKNITANLEPVSSRHSQGTLTRDTVKGKRSLLALIAANLIPLFGVFLLGWQLSDIIILYWAETLILWFYQSIRNIAISPIRGLVQSLFNGAQIMFFAAIHFLFIWLIFVQAFWTSSSGADQSITTVFSYLASLWPALLGLAISHGYSLVIHFFNSPYANRTQATVKSLFLRIFVIHVMVIFGGILALISDGHWASLLLLIGLKTIVDARTHNNKHGLQEF